MLRQALTLPETSTSWSLVRARLQQGDALGAVDAIDFEAQAVALRDRVWPRLEAVFERAFSIVRRRMVPQPLIKAADPETFAQTNPRAQEWAAQQSARLVSGITEETRAALRAVVSRAFTDQIPPRQLVTHIRAVLGLTVRQAEQLARRREDWVDSGLSLADVERRVHLEAVRLLRQRALTIARTETMAASNAGQLLAWGDARSAGVLESDLVKEWIVTNDDRLCPICEPMRGQQRELDQAFEGGVQGPPLHPQCRCAIGLATPRRDSHAA